MTKEIQGKRRFGRAQRGGHGSDGGFVVGRFRRTRLSRLEPPFDASGFQGGQP